MDSATSQTPLSDHPPRGLGCAVHEVAKGDIHAVEPLAAGISRRHRGIDQRQR